MAGGTQTNHQKYLNVNYINQSYKVKARRTISPGPFLSESSA